MEQTIVEDKNGLIFHIDKSTHSATVTVTPDAAPEVFIPRYVSHESQEYPIKDLSLRSSSAVSINFPEDSELETIKDTTLSYSQIKELFIPASVKNLEKGWCHNVSTLFKVNVSPNNTNFSNFDKDIIIGKSDLTSDAFDTLYFVSRNVNQITIPSFIKKINSYAFSECDQLVYVSFSENSELEVIDDYSFTDSKISTFSVPNRTKIIGKSAFKFCYNLAQIKFSEDSELHSICEEAFVSTLIKHLHIPANLRNLEDGWCKSTNISSLSISPKNKTFSIIEGKMIVGKSNPESDDDFDILYFVSRDAADVVVPPNVKVIKSYAFHLCNKLKTVSISEDSKLKEIEKFAFKSSSIKRIDIPKSVTTISDYAFYKSELQEVNFSDESKLKIIGKNAFSRTSIERINIPKHVETIGNQHFMNAGNSKKSHFVTKMK